MADFSFVYCTRSVSANALQAGERVRVQILNADGSQKTLLVDDSVPAGVVANMSASISLLKV